MSGPIHAGARVRFTVCLDCRETIALRGVVITAYGRKSADVLFDGAPLPSGNALVSIPAEHLTVVERRAFA